MADLELSNHNSILDKFATDICILLLTLVKLIETSFQKQ